MKAYSFWNKGVSISHDFFVSIKHFFLINNLGIPILFLFSDPENERIIKEKQRREMKGRVEEWKQNIMPILRSLKEQDFDIHEYGSKIMNSMEVNETKPFKKMVQGKPCLYFHISYGSVN